MDTSLKQQDLLNDLSRSYKTPLLLIPNENTRNEKYKPALSVLEQKEIFTSEQKLTPKPAVSLP